MGERTDDSSSGNRTEVDPVKKAKVILYSSVYALTEALQVDENMRERVRDWDLVVQWTLPVDETTVYLTFKDIDVEITKGRHENPDVEFGFNSIEDALAVFSGTLSPSQMMAKVTVKGDLEEAAKMAVLFKMATKYSP